MTTVGKVLFDATGRESRGMKLEDFIMKYKNELTGVRAFYIIEPNALAQRKVKKFGIAGFDNKGTALKRMNDYWYAYGSHDNTGFNKCIGAKVLYVRTTKLSPTTSKLKSYIYKLEKFMKKELESRNKIVWADEYTNETFPELKQIINTYGRREGVVDEPVAPRQSNRVSDNMGRRRLRSRWYDV